jgi:hypothetical protein
LRLSFVTNWIIFGIFSYIVDYLKCHSQSVDQFAITMDDCAHVFRKVPYNGEENEVVREKWRLVGQCLSRVCSKRCTWSDLEVRANAPNVCDYTTGAEEAIVLWLFVSEGEDWLLEFNKKNGGSHDGDHDAETTSTSRRKKNGQHKTLSYLKHWWQLKTLVKARRLNHDISEKWEEAWKLFACEELKAKKNKKGSRKRSIQDVLPTFEDVLGVGESEGDYTSGLEIEDFALLCTQTSGV